MWKASLVICALLGMAFMDMPYGYYMFLRLAVCAYAIGAAIFLHGKFGFGFLCMLAIAAAILYNPVFRVALERSQWQWINGVTIVLALLLAFASILSDEKVSKLRSVHYRSILRNGGVWLLCILFYGGVACFLGLGVYMMFFYEKTGLTKQEERAFRQKKEYERLWNEKMKPVREKHDHEHQQFMREKLYELQQKELPESQRGKPYQFDKWELEPGKSRSLQLPSYRKATL